MTATAERIREVREDLGLSQKRFAALLGVTQESVSMWEAGTWRPTDKHAGAIDRLAGEMLEGTA